MTAATPLRGVSDAVSDRWSVNRWACDLCSADDVGFLVESASFEVGRYSSGGRQPTICGLGDASGIDLPLAPVPPDQVVAAEQGRVA